MKTLRLAVPLVLATFTLTCQSDQATAPNDIGIRTAPGGVPGPNPDRGGGGKDGDDSFALSFDGNDGTYTPDSDALDVRHTFTIEGWIKPGNTLGTAESDDPLQVGWRRRSLLRRCLRPSAAWASDDGHTQWRRQQQDI